MDLAPRRLQLQPTPQYHLQRPQSTQLQSQQAQSAPSLGFHTFPLSNPPKPQQPQKLTCICSQEDLSKARIQCTLCHSSQHILCIDKAKDLHPYVCPCCQTRLLDPLSPTHFILLPPFAIPKIDNMHNINAHRHKHSRYFMITNNMMSSSYNPVVIQVRAVCLASSEPFCHAWPPKGLLFVNEKLVKEFKLPEGNVATKRRDIPLVVSNCCEIGRNKIEIFMEGGSKTQSYACVVLACALVSVDDALKNVQEANKSRPYILDFNRKLVFVFLCNFGF